MAAKLDPLNWAPGGAMLPIEAYEEYKPQTGDFKLGSQNTM